MRVKSLPKLIVSLAIPQLAGIIGAYITAPAIPTWYSGLAKPDITPPDWLFAPVWTALYLLMGVSLYIVWSRGRPKRLLEPLAAFDAQIVMSVFWTFLFFGVKSTGLGLAAIATLWLAVLATVLAFRTVSKTAALLLVPYLLWVSLALLLNFQIWVLN